MPVLWIMNISGNDKLEPVLHCHTDEPMGVRDLKTYIHRERKGFMGNDFWVLLAGRSGVTSVTSNRVAVVFQYVEMICGYRNFYTGRPYDLVEAMMEICSAQRTRDRKKTEAQGRGITDGETCTTPDVTESISSITGKRAVEMDDGEVVTSKRTRLDSPSPLNLTEDTIWDWIDWTGKPKTGYM